MERPLVTIAVSTYNRASGYLKEALASALAQTYEPLEIVVVDNASTDETSQVVASMADARVRYVRHDTNIGANGNFNACLEQARGTYFLLLHDDDRIDGDFVDYVMEALGRWQHPVPPGLIRTGNRVMDANGQVLSERRNAATGRSAADLARAWFQRRTSMYFCNTVFHTAALREAGGFHSQRDLFIDVAAVFRIASQYPVLDVPDVKASFRRHGGNNGTAQSIEAWCEDSVYLLDLICEVAADQRAEIRTLGLPFLINNNYTRAARLSRRTQRVLAHWTVFRVFGYQALPLRIGIRRQLRHLKRSFGRT